MAETVVIMAERLGLPPDATPEQIRDKVHVLAEENVHLKHEVNIWRERAEKQTAELAEGRKAIDKVKEMEARLFVEKAIRDQRIDKADEEKFLRVFQLDRKLAEQWIEERAHRDFMAKEQGIGLDLPVMSAVDEVRAKAEALMASDKSLTLAVAQMRVLQDEKLYERYRAETVSGAARGGER